MNETINKIKILRLDRFRSSPLVNKTDDMVRVTLAMTSRNFRKMIKNYDIEWLKDEKHD